MTISSHDAVLIARAVNVFFRVGINGDQVLAKSSEDIRSLVRAIRAEGARVEMLDCYRELFPDGAG
jgi:hypothetical protein